MGSSATDFGAGGGPRAHLEDDACATGGLAGSRQGCVADRRGAEDLAVAHSQPDDDAEQRQRRELRSHRVHDQRAALHREANRVPHRDGNVAAQARERPAGDHGAGERRVVEHVVFLDLAGPTIVAEHGQLLDGDLPGAVDEEGRVPARREHDGRPALAAHAHRVRPEHVDGLAQHVDARLQTDDATTILHLVDRILDGQRTTVVADRRDTDIAGTLVAVTRTGPRHPAVAQHRIIREVDESEAGDVMVRGARGSVIEHLDGGVGDTRSKCPAFVRAEPAMLGSRVNSI